MKIWIKLLIGLVLGVVLAVLLPAKQNAAIHLFNISEIVINIGIYAVFPLIFFSSIMAVYELRLEKRVFRVYGRMLVFLVLSTIVLSFIGIATALIFRPRIPILTMTATPPQIPGLLETLYSIFPRNLFGALVGDGDILLPLLILAFIFGANLTFDRIVTRPVIGLCDSLSRIFYHISSLIVELYAIAFIAVTASNVIRIYMVDNLSIYSELILILGIDVAIVVLGIYPGILYLLDRQQNPYKLLYSGIAPALTGLVTGNQYLPLVMLAKHGKENLGIPRKVGSTAFPFFAVFGRAGTALVASVSFYLILNSLLPAPDINFVKILYVFCFSILVSFVLGSVPGLGTYVAVTLLCYQFDRFWPTFGLLNHYMILEPIKFLLVSFGIFLDVITSYLSTYLVSLKENLASVKDMRDFI
jgi:aerobic C4-dicarboxylate transport protein